MRGSTGGGIRGWNGSLGGKIRGSLSLAGPPPSIGSLGIESMRQPAVKRWNFSRKPPILVSVKKFWARVKFVRISTKKCFFVCDLPHSGRDQTWNLLRPAMV